MEWRNVQSRNIATIRADGSKLQIRFNNGKIYEYDDVPNDVISELLNAPSHGKYFASNISKTFKYRSL